MSGGARDAAVFFDPQRLRLARQLRAVTRTELARRAGISPAAISQYELGTHKPRPDTTIRLAFGLGVPVSFFKTPPGALQPLPNVEASFFRSLRRTTQRDREKATALAGLASELIRLVDDAVVLPAFEPIDDLALDANDDLEAAEYAATVVRDRWQLPDGPIEHVVRLLERHGIVVLQLGIAESQDVDAYSWTQGPRPLVILGTDRGGYDRSRLTAGHELAHVLLHRADPAPANAALEAQAQRFAGALLIPEPALRDAWPHRRIDWNDLQRLRHQWGISMAALLYRARELELLTPTAYTNAMKYMSRMGWRRREPGPDRAPEQPALLLKALQLLDSNGTSLEDLAARGNLLGVDELRDALGLSGTTRPVVEL